MLGGHIDIVPVAEGRDLGTSAKVQSVGLH